MSFGVDVLQRPFVPSRICIRAFFLMSFVLLQFRVHRGKAYHRRESAKHGGFSHEAVLATARSPCFFQTAVVKYVAYSHPCGGYLVITAERCRKLTPHFLPHLPLALLMGFTLPRALPLPPIMSSSNTNPKTVGYIGLGNAGFHLARQIALAGHTLVVRDASPSQVAKFVHDVPGSRAAAEGPMGFLDVDILVTMLPQREHCPERAVGGRGGRQGAQERDGDYRHIVGGPVQHGCDGEGAAGGARTLSRRCRLDAVQAPRHFFRRGYVHGWRRGRTRRSRDGNPSHDGVVRLPDGGTGDRSCCQDIEQLRFSGQHLRPLGLIHCRNEVRNRPPPTNSRLQRRHGQELLDVLQHPR